MANRTRLFKKFPRDLVELRKTEFDKERNLHDMVEQNIGKLFPELVVLGSEFERDGYRLDTVAFNKRRNTFVIIEYKNRRDDKVLVQAQAYLGNMDRRLKDSFGLLYAKKTGDTGTAEFDWDGAYAIILAPEFTRMQIDAARANPFLEMYTISVYEDGIISLTSVGDEKRSKPAARNADAVPISSPKTAPGMDSLYSEARAKLLSAFPGMVEKQMKYYGRFEVGDRLLCTMGKQKSKIWLYYSGRIDNPAPDQPEFVGLSERGGWGTGRWRSTIRNRADFDRALTILKGLRGNTGRR